MNTLKRYFPEILSFFGGAIVMIFEILGSRMVGPYIGTSLFVWTSIIAIILGSLSLGYYFGGKLSDKKASLSIIAFIFLISSCSFLILFLIKDIFLQTITNHIQNIKISSIIISLILFSPVSFLLGMISPLSIKIKMLKISTGGETLGRIGSIGTLGSIVGTLSAGFFLVPLFGVNLLLLLLGLACLTLSLIGGYNIYKKIQILVGICFLVCFYIEYQTKIELKHKGVQTFDTSYSHITLTDDFEQDSLEPVRILKIDNTTHAGMYLKSKKLLFEYTKYYHLFDVFHPTAKSIVMFGGAAYSFPKSFLDTYPEKRLEVIEIDPMITKIAKKYFGLKSDGNLTITHQDARVFLNTTQDKYDVILGDAFGSFYSIPYQLTTFETVKRKHDILNKNGIVLLNIIGSMKGEKSRFVQAEYKTYQQVFSEVFVIPVETSDPYEVQNIILVAAKNKKDLSFETKIEDYKKYLKKKRYLSVEENTKILTDNYAPVDYYVSKLLD